MMELSTIGVLFSISVGLFGVCWWINKRKSGFENVLSNEKNNFLRYFLCQNIATQAVRMFFRTKVPESTLAFHLINNKGVLKYGPAKCTLDQLKLLFPVGAIVSSESFDFTLLYKLTRHTIPVTTLPTPSQGWGREPQVRDINEADDMERIRSHRNKIAHNAHFELSETEFRIKWNDLSKAIERLSNAALSREVDLLRTKKFDKQDSHDLTTEFVNGVQHMKEEIIQLQEGVEHTRISTVENICKVNGKVDEVKEKLNDLKDKIDVVKENAADVDENVGYVKEKVDYIQEKMDDVKDEIVDVKEKVNYIEEKIDDIRNKHIPVHIKTSMQQQLVIWKDEDQVFYGETSVCTECWDMVRSKQIITFIGAPGSGKSATSRHIALKLEKEDGYEIVPVCKPEQILDFVHIEKKQVFVLDDVFGKRNLDVTLYNNTEGLKDSFLTRLGRNTKIIFTCRKTVYYEARRLKSYITENVIDYQSAENLFLENDKLRILQIHCKNKQIRKADFENISWNMLQSANFMFPLLCKLFSTDAKYRKQGGKFFNKPIECLLDEMDKLQAASKNQYSVLILCLVSDKNEISAESLPPKQVKEDVFNNCGAILGTSDRQLIDSLEEMNGTYLKRSDKTYTFINDFIFELVAHHYGNKFPGHILKYMQSDFIATKVDVRQYPASVDPLSIVLSPDQYVLLAERLYLDIEALKLDDVFTNPALKYPPFLNKFIAVLNSKTFIDIRALFLSRRTYIKDCFYLRSQPIRERIKTEKWEESHRQFILLHTTTDACGRLNIDCVFEIRTVSWIIYYGHVKLLQKILDFVIQNRSSPSKEFFLSDSLEQSRLLTLACFSNSLSMVETLLEYTDDDCINNICYSDSQDVSFFINWHKLYTPLHAACQVGNIDILNAFFKRNANINLIVKYPWSPFIAAVVKGQIEVIQHLYEKVDGENFKIALVIAAMYGHNDIVRFFVQHGADVNFCEIKLDLGFTPVLAASCLEGHLETIKYLEEKGADLKQTDKYHRSCLFFASQSGDIDLVRFCIEKGLDINLTDDSGVSVLERAACRGHVEVVKQLIEKGCDIYISGKDLSEPENDFCLLCLAIEKYNFDIVKCLVDNGVEIKNQCSYFNSPCSHLFMAVKTGSFPMTKLLLEQGVDVNMGDFRNEPPIRIAIDNDRPDLVKLLVAHGADITKSQKEIFTSSDKEM